MIIRYSLLNQARRRSGLLDQHDVALIITDQRMPEMTGVELLKRTVTLRPHMVRIILTGYTDADALTGDKRDSAGGA